MRGDTGAWTDTESPSDGIGPTLFQPARAGSECAAGETRWSRWPFPKTLTCAREKGVGRGRQFFSVGNSLRRWRGAGRSRRNASGDQTRPCHALGWVPRRRRGRDTLLEPRAPRGLPSAPGTRPPRTQATTVGTAAPAPWQPDAPASPAQNSRRRGTTGPDRARTCRPPGSGSRSVRRPGLGSPHTRSAGSTPRAAGSVEAALRTSCPGSFLWGWTVHRARSVCEAQSGVSHEARDVPAPGARAVPLRCGSEEAAE